jgi:mRNA interferase MazF
MSPGSPVLSQGDVWWADLPEPAGSGPGLRRPVVVVQGDAFNRSGIATVVCVPLTSNLRWSGAPGNVVLKSRLTGLPKESVANVSLVVALDRRLLTERVGRLPRRKVDLILGGIDVVLGREMNELDH